MDKRILLVEDNPDDIVLAQRAFKKTNSEAILDIARDGREALDALLACEPEAMPHLILLDLQLPRLSGLELLRELRDTTHTRNLPVVIMSSSDENADIEASYRLGANSFIRKPIDFAEFLGLVTVLQAYWLQLNRLPKRS